MLEHLKEHQLHGDLRPGETPFFQTPAAWMMWNWQLGARVWRASGLVRRADISPALWQIVSEEQVNVFGTSPYLKLCAEQEFEPAKAFPLDSLRAVLSTGSISATVS